MERIVTVIAIASIVFAAPAFAQGRFGSEAKERAADREYREAVRRAEHPELYEKPDTKTAEAPAQETPAPAQAVEPSAAAPTPATPAPAQ